MVIIKINGIPLQEKYPRVEIVEQQDLDSWKNQNKSLWAMLSAAYVFAPTYASAQGKSISEAAAPIVNLIEDLAGPVCRIMFVIGFILVIIGKPRQGIDKMKWAGLGYIGIMWMPMIMNIISTAGQGA